MEKNLKERWNGKTPKFWKRVQRWAIITGAVATTAAALSQLTVEDTKTKKDDKEN